MVSPFFQLYQISGVTLYLMHLMFFFGSFTACLFSVVILNLLSSFSPLPTAIWTLYYEMRLIWYLRILTSLPFVGMAVSWWSHFMFLLHSLLFYAFYLALNCGQTFEWWLHTHNCIYTQCIYIYLFWAYLILSSAPEWLLACVGCAWLILVPISFFFLSIYIINKEICISTYKFNLVYIYNYSTKYFYIQF